MRRADPRTKKDAAARIVQLPQGSVQFESVDEAVVTGEVCRALEPGRLRMGDTRSEKFKHGGMVRVGLGLGLGVGLGGGLGLGLGLA